MEHSSEATEDIYKVNNESDLNIIQHSFHLLTARCPKNKQELRPAAEKAEQSVTRKENLSVDFTQRICNQVLKMTLFTFISQKNINQIKPSLGTEP